jgi:hypothetical protein
MGIEYCRVNLETLYHGRALSNTDNESSLSFYVETARTVSLYVMIEGRQKFADREIESLKERVGSVGNSFSKLPPALASGLKVYWKFLALAKSHRHLRLKPKGKLFLNSAKAFLYSPLSTS